jgi:hypothetical protein
MIEDEDSVLRYKNFSIEIDCPPGDPRPCDLIYGVIDGSGLVVDDFDTAPPFYGHQTWILKACPIREQKFKSSKPVFKERLLELYNKGLVRCCSW